MRPLLLNLLLALVWLNLTALFTSMNFVIGFVLSYVVLFLFRGTLFPSSSYFSKFVHIVYFLLYFFYELIKANLKVAYEVLTPQYNMRPAIIAVPLDVDTDLEINILANLITLTPGTLSLDVSENRDILYVHAMYVDDKDEFIQSIKNGFERRVMELLR